jgi:hypothetical protein
MSKNWLDHFGAVENLADFAQRIWQNFESKSQVKKVHLPHLPQRFKGSFEDAIPTSDPFRRRQQKRGQAKFFFRNRLNWLASTWA